MIEPRVEMDTATERATRPGPDRLTVALLSLAAFLAVLALLAGQIRASAHRAQLRREIVVRRIYQTTVVGSAGGPGAATSVAQSVSGPGGSSYASAPGAATRSS